MVNGALNLQYSPYSQQLKLKQKIFQNLLLVKNREINRQLVHMQQQRLRKQLLRARTNCLKEEKVLPPVACVVSMV
jgi:hypothetical protein